MKNRSVLLLALLMTVLLLLLGACGSQGDDNKYKSSSSSDMDDGDGTGIENVKITLWTRWPELVSVMNDTIQAFHEKFPHIIVEHTLVPGNQYVASLQAAISGNDLPDMFGFHNNLPIYRLTELGVIRHINDVFTAEEAKKYYEGTWAEGYTTMRNAKYILPLMTPKRPDYQMFYNKDVLKKAGLTEADLPKTWDELKAFGKKIKEKTNGEVYGVGIGLKTAWAVSALTGEMASAITPEVVNNGGFFNYHTGKYEYDNEGVIETIELWKELLEDGAMDPNSLVSNFQEMAALHQAGKVALHLTISSVVGMLDQAQIDNIGAAELPTKDGKPYYRALLGGSPDGILVSKETKHYEEVKRFLNYVQQYFYKRLVELGVEDSPYAEINRAADSSCALCKRRGDIQDKHMILVPVPFQRNINTIKVHKEINGKMPTMTIGTVVEGYLTGQLTNIRAPLREISEESNEVFEQSMKMVKSAGFDVDRSDYIYPDWKPLKTYVTQGRER
jgi:ABC-type glycerol-3-phosphate transport system substrate-binding protein